MHRCALWTGGNLSEGNSELREVASMDVLPRKSI
jgi:hypothetical protein